MLFLAVEEIGGGHSPDAVNPDRSGAYIKLKLFNHCITDDGSARFCVLRDLARCDLSITVKGVPSPHGPYNRQKTNSCKSLTFEIV